MTLEVTPATLPGLEAAAYAPGQAPLVSVVIPVWNAVDTIGRAIESVLQSGYPNVELVVVDGASTDGTLDVIGRYRERIAYFQTGRDGGIYEAMNIGVDHAGGEWLLFLGADDYLLPGFARIGAQLVDPQTIYLGDCLLSSGTVYRGKPGRYALSKRPTNHQSVFYPRSVFRKYRYDTRYRILADCALNITLWGDKEFRRVYMPVVVAFYTLGGTSLDSLRDEAFMADRPGLIRKNLGCWVALRFDLRRFWRRLRKKNYLDW